VNDLRPNTPEKLNYEGPISNILFDSNGQQEGEATISLLPASVNNSAATSTVRLVIAGLAISRDPSQLRILSAEKTAIKCAENPKVVYSKTVPDEVHDELNPITGPDALTAYK
jgi:hypothetical protein